MELGVSDAIVGFGNEACLLIPGSFTAWGSIQDKCQFYMRRLECSEVRRKKGCLGLNGELSLLVFQEDKGLGELGHVS